MKTCKAILAALAVMGSASAAHADLTLNGAVGLPLNPTAQLPPENTWRVQGSYFDLGNNANNSVVGDNGDAKFYGLHASGRIGNRLEINGGIERLNFPGNVFFPLGVGGVDLDESGFSLGAKYLFTRESDPAGVRLAAGVGYSRAFARNLYGYVVGTKSFGRGITEGRAPITGHLGLRWDRFDAGENGGPESKKVSVYGGLEVPFTRSGDWSFVGELQSKIFENANDPLLTESKTPYSASIRYRPAGKGFSASLGWQRRGYPSLISDSGIFAQIGYTFGEGEGTENENDAAGTTTTTTTTTTVAP